MDSTLKLLHRLQILFVGITSLFLVACSAVTAPPVEEQSPTQPPEIIPTATEIGTEPLTICLGQEPNTLSPYGNPNNAARQVLQAMYDGPIDQLAYEYAPVILEELPTLENGGVQIRQVVVSAGDLVAGEDGGRLALGSGALVRPSGCEGGDCVLVYSNGEISMDQLVVTFRLNAGLTWSDGMPLTAGDSVYARRFNSEFGTTASKFRFLHTAAYEALDEFTVVWTGLPGYIAADYVENFWLPLPEHLRDELDPGSFGMNTAPPQIGWGAYTFDSWEAGQQITLKSNPNYYRAAERLPLHDELIFRFVGQGGPENVASLQSGECDLLGADTGLDMVVPELLALQEAGEAQIAFAQGDQWLHLDFGIQHIDYDDGYNQGLGDRPNYFADASVRQAFAQCINRQALVEQFTWMQGEVMNTYVPASHPLFATQAAAYIYDPQAGISLLESAGWLTAEDGVRVSQGVAGVLDGTRLEISYLTSDTADDVAIGEMISTDLAGCGIGVNVESLPAQSLLNYGPTGLLFGRQFDLAQFAWPLGNQAACFLYMSEAIPGDDLNDHRFGWGGWNASGWENLEFDLACKAARNSFPGSGGYASGHQQAQSIFAEQLPVIPLFAEVELVAARADLCGLAFDETAGVLWNVESLGFGKGCQ